MIAIIRGCGANIASVQFALERLGKQSILTTDANSISAASHVILPGVGTAKQAMLQLQELRLIEVIQKLSQPVLGICLGMQILYEFSHEGDTDGLAIIPGRVSHLPTDKPLTIPHIGWNQLQFYDNKSPILQDISNNNYFYFVHSYMAPVNEYTLATTNYGKNFAALVQKNNFYGMQFHPERSGKVGENILQNFLDL